MKYCNQLCLSLQEVMRVRHDFVCCVGCCWCATDSSCGYEIQIEAPVGNVLGYAKQQYVALSNSIKYWSFKRGDLCNFHEIFRRTSKWKPHIRIFDANRQPLYVVRGPCCGCQGVCCTDDVDFPVSSVQGTTRRYLQIPGKNEKKEEI